MLIYFILLVLLKGILVKAFFELNLIFTMVFLYTVVSYMIYVPLQKSCILAFSKNRKSGKRFDISLPFIQNSLLPL